MALKHYFYTMMPIQYNTPEDVLTYAPKFPMIEHDSDRDRYTNILPYQYNGVSISGRALNASHIDFRFRAIHTPFIASQGPKNEKDAADFLTMVMEKNCRQIVCIGPSIEDHKEKFFQYWPDNGRTPFRANNSFGQLVTVSVIQNNASPGIVRRQLQITIGDKETTVEQLHLHTWKDHSALSREEFISHIKAVRFESENGNDLPPITVHCSAGVGRTGTFIAGWLRYNYRIDTPALVHQLRDMRTSMVMDDGQFRMVEEVDVHDPAASVEHLPLQRTGETFSERLPAMDASASAAAAVALESEENYTGLPVSEENRSVLLTLLGNQIGTNHLYQLPGEPDARFAFVLKGKMSSFSDIFVCFDQNATRTLCIEFEKEIHFTELRVLIRVNHSSFDLTNQQELEYFKTKLGLETEDPRPVRLLSADDQELQRLYLYEEQNNL